MNADDLDRAEMIDAPKQVSVHREEIQRQRDAGVAAPGQASALKAVLGMPE